MEAGRLSPASRRVARSPLSRHGRDDDAAPSLADLQERWRGVLYVEPYGMLHGHKVGPFGWRGLSVEQEHSAKPMLRAKLGSILNLRKKRPAPGSDALA